MKRIYIVRKHSMVHHITVTLHDCKHCGGTGTCTSGKDGHTCAACVKKNELSFWQRFFKHKGLLCGSCGGIGQAEAMSERYNNRIGPFLALMLVFVPLMMVGYSAFTHNPYFPQILTFSGTVIGTVAGFYFSSSSRN